MGSIPMDGTLKAPMPLTVAAAVIFVTTWLAATNSISLRSLVCGRTLFVGSDLYANPLG